MLLMLRTVELRAMNLCMIFSKQAFWTSLWQHKFIILILRMTFDRIFAIVVLFYHYKKCQKSGVVNFLTYIQYKIINGIIFFFQQSEHSSKSEVSPRKRARMSIVDKATEEGKALLKELGFDDSETPGRRRTRAATKGVVYTPPPKRERKSAGTPSST